MNWQSVGYALICVVVPVLWGLGVVWGSNRVERLVLRRRKGSAKRRTEPLPPIEYHI
jgi:hypothetical protein